MTINIEIMVGILMDTQCRKKYNMKYLSAKEAKNIADETKNAHDNELIKKYQKEIDDVFDLIEDASNKGQYSICIKAKCGSSYAIELMCSKYGYEVYIPSYVKNDELDMFISWT